MKNFSAWSRWIGAIFWSLWLAGCSPEGVGGDDELKEAHYLAGRNLVQSMDYKGAEAAFKKAIEVNPQSSAAHYDLGLLYANKLVEGAVTQEERDWDYVAAIYHLERYLRLSPKPKLADQVRQQIMACKIEVTKTVPATLLSQNLQNEFERLSNTNGLLRKQVEQMKLEMAQQAYASSNRLATLQAQYAAAVAAANNTPQPTPQRVEPNSPPPTRAVEKVSRQPATAGEKPSPNSNTKQPPSASSRQPANPPPHSSPPSRSKGQETASTRHYKAQSGETFASIARKHRIPITSLIAANPTIEPRKLKAGQTLKIPESR
jgi:LysM repeat protein